MPDSTFQRPPEDWYLKLAAHLGRAYLDYRFTQGTEQEAGFLMSALSLKPGDRLLDVGCGPARHAVELALKGVDVLGVDISPEFLTIARERAEAAGTAISFFEMDAGELPFEEEFDAVISISEGAFGLGGDDLKILRAMTRALKPGGYAAVCAANLFYVVDHLNEGDFLDPVTCLFRRTVEEVQGEDGSVATFEMWSSCYTPRELEWIANGAGLDPEFVNGVAPGDFQGRMPAREHPELLLLARKP